MLEKIKSLWSKYKIHVTVVGGALVVASVYGQCTFEPNVDAIEEAAEEVETNPVNTTEEGTTEAATETTETTGTTGTTTTGTTTTGTTTN
jgi:hypothetical protein